MTEQETTAALFALVPLRNHKPIFGGGRPHDGFVSKIDTSGQFQPFVTISINESSSKGQILGRVDFCHAMWDACFRSRGSQFDGTNVCYCSECSKVLVWAKRYLSRRLLRVETSESNSKETISVSISKSKQPTEQYVKIISKSSGEASAGATLVTDDTWLGLGMMKVGDILQLPCPSNEFAADQVASLELQLCRIDDTEEETTIMPPKQLAPIQSPRSRYGVALQVLDGQGDSEKNADDGDEECDDNDENMSLASQQLESQEAYRPTARDNEQKILHDSSSSGAQTSSSSPKMGSEPALIAPQSLSFRSVPMASCELQQRLDHDDDGEKGTHKEQQETRPDDEKLGSQMLWTTTKDNKPKSVADRDKEMKESDAVTSKPAIEVGVALVHPKKNTDEGSAFAVVPQKSGVLQTMVSEATDIGTKSLYATEPAISDKPTLLNDSSSPGKPDEISSETKKFVLYFVRKGTDMTKAHIDGEEKREGLRAHAERRMGTVLDSFEKTHPPWPTHFVISHNIQPSAVAACLGFSDVDEMASFLDEHGIVCAKRKWAARGNNKSWPPLEEPDITRDELYYGFGIARKRNKGSKRSRSWPADKNVSSRNVRQKVDRSSPIVRNEKLSEVFRQLSKRYKECPLDEVDEWRAYTFNLIAGRLRHLDFDVINDPDVLEQLKRVKHFGSSTMEIVKEYLTKGSVDRLEKFYTDKRRVAMRAMMNIWGVGRAKALKLVNADYDTIGKVRDAINSGVLKLDRNQYIGVICYEDIMEEMSRAEVETIADIVSAAVKERFPSAELTIMGSYRRGKVLCGDVDILITHPDYDKEVPAKYLGIIVDELRSAGHIAHHLTFIAGMKHERFESLPNSAANKLTSPDHYGRSHDKKDKFNASSWMGIFNSPVVIGKCRRVDIKWYPYAERVFASLYFTGNGHFNRSMRLWATKKFNYRLSDHGLVHRDTKQPVMREPSSEKKVFEELGLIWKEPTERDCFDAVESTQGEAVSEVVDEMTEKDLKEDMRRENRELVWIN